MRVFFIDCIKLLIGKLSCFWEDILVILVIAVFPVCLAFSLHTAHCLVHFTRFTGSVILSVSPLPMFSAIFVFLLFSFSSVFPFFWLLRERKSMLTSAAPQTRLLVTSLRCTVCTEWTLNMVVCIFHPFRAWTEHSNIPCLLKVLGPYRPDIKLEDLRASFDFVLYARCLLTWPVARQASGKCIRWVNC